MNLFRRVFFSALFLGGAALLALDTAPVMNKAPLEAARVFAAESVRFEQEGALSEARVKELQAELDLPLEPDGPFPA